MKAIDSRSGDFVDVTLTEDTPHIFLFGVERFLDPASHYPVFDYATPRVKEKLADMYDLPSFDGTHIFKQFRVGDNIWDIRQSAKLSSSTVINANGAEVDFAAAVELMDDGIRERLHAEISPCSEQEFFSAYELAHADEFGEVWELSKKDPVY